MATDDRISSNQVQVGYVPDSKAQVGHNSAFTGYVAATLYKFYDYEVQVGWIPGSETINDTIQGEALAVKPELQGSFSLLGAKVGVKR